MESMQNDKEYVRRTVEERDVHFIQFWFTDVLGNLKSFAATPGELDEALSEGIGFDGSCVEGFSRAEESDCIAMPDPETFQILPWRPQHQGAARMFCKIKLPNGEPFPGDPRACLQRICDATADRGYVFNVASAIEHFYFADNEGTKTLDKGGYFDFMTLDSGTDLRRDTVLMLEKMGIPVEFSHHEAAPSQHQIDLRGTDALSMADQVMTHRLVVKQVARQSGVYATFMPKPIENVDGSGMHLHLSLYDFEDNNLFYDSADPSGCCLSELAKQFLAGLLKYAPEYTLVTNQYVNSYKRFVRGFDAPIFVSWAQANRAALVRVPHVSDKTAGSRLDLRSPDPACNPYLAFAAILAAGLAGIDEGLELPPVHPDNVFDMSAAELAERGIRRLPTNMGEAIDNFEQSSLMRGVLGDHIFDFIVRAKRAEWEQYCSKVGDWELKRFLPVL